MIFHSLKWVLSKIMGMGTNLHHILLRELSLIIDREECCIDNNIQLGSDHDSVGSKVG